MYILNQHGLACLTLHTNINISQYEVQNTHTNLHFMFQQFIEIHSIYNKTNLFA